MKRLMFDDVRRWQVPFEIIDPLETLPRPEVIVEEIQTSPSYRLSGVNRQNQSGGQFIVTFTGCGGVDICGKSHRLPPGCGFLHRHNDPEVCYYYPPEGKAPWIFLWMAFEGTASEEILTEITRKYGYLFQCAPDSPLIEKMLSYKKCDHELLFLTPMEGAKLVMDFLQTICSPLESRKRNSTRAALTAQAQACIVSRLGEPLKISEIAEHLDVSREHLSRVFREQTGETLLEYLTRKRLSFAAELLLQSRLRSKEIADRCGYSDYSAFCRAFRNLTGISPEKVRSSGIYPSFGRGKRTS